MITQRTHEQPAMRSGILCHGKVNTDATGQAEITVKGIDYTSRLTGFSFSVVNNASQIININIVSIVYSASTRLNTITIAATTHTGSVNPVTDLQDAIVAALRNIVAAAPADTAALLTEITTAGNSIESTVIVGIAPDVVAYEGVVYYSFWIDDEPEGLPADLSTNDTELQSY